MSGLGRQLHLRGCRLALGVGGALVRPPPRSLAHWRVGLFAVLVAVLLVDATVPPSNFPMLLLWLWAGVLAGAHLREASQ